MNRTSFARHYGFAHPYDFRISIPFLLNSIGSLVAAAVAAVLFVEGELRIGTERFYFFGYVIVAFMVGAIVSRATAISAAIFGLCIVEAFLAASSHALRGSVPTLFPNNVFTLPADDRFINHSLLQVIPRKNWRSVQRLNQQDEVRYRNWKMNWNQLKEELVFQHNSLGIRGKELAAEDYSRDMIFVYGGSTTYEVTVTQGSTWTEQLERELGGSHSVLNFGVPAHSSAEHLVYTAFYERINETVPVCALYYVGWNDIHNAHISNLDRAYADWHLPNNHDWVKNREVWAARYSPLVSLLSRVARRSSSRLTLGMQWSAINSAAQDARLEDIFAGNIKTISAINATRNIKAVFIGQVLNRAYLQHRPDDPNQWIPRVKNKDVWKLQERFNALLRETAISSGAVYIDPGIDNFDIDDFADQGHFSANGSLKLARSIVRQVADTCART